MMQSKTSLFNTKLYGRDVKGYMPFAGIIIFLMLVVFVLPSYISRGNSYSLFFGNGAIEGLLFCATNPVLIGIFCEVSAVLVFSYLYKRRSSYMLHAMPISRDSQFFSHYLAGLTLMLIIAAATYLCAFITAFAFGSKYTGYGIFICLLYTLIQIVFFYSLAVFVAVVVGNVALSIITFGVLNALWLFIDIIISNIQSMIMVQPIVEDFGNDEWFVMFSGEALFPALFFGRRVSVFDVDEQVRHLGESALMLIPAVCFMVLAMLLYRRKKIELTGEMVAFEWCRVVFRVMFTVCGGMLIMSIILLPSIGVTSYDVVGNVVTLVLCICIGGAISFLISEMLLNKSVHIFKKKIPYLQGIIPLAVIILLICIAPTGIFTPKAIPDDDDVTQVVVAFDGSSETNQYRFTDREAIKRLLEVNRKLVENDELVELAKKVHSNYGNGEDEVISEEEFSGQVSVRIYDGDGTKRYLQYCYGDSTKDMVFESFLPLIEESGYVTKAIFGQKPEDIYLTDARFYDMRESAGGVSLNPRAFSMDYEYAGYDDEEDYEERTNVQKVETLAFSDEERYRIEGVNLTELYTAIQADLKDGNMLPYPSDDVETIGDYEGNDVLGTIELSASLKNDEEGRLWNTYNDWTFVGLTAKSRNTLEVLKRYGAVK